MASFDIQPVAYTLGARVTGLDLRQGLSEDTYRELRTAWLEHLVLIFPDQDLDKYQFTNLAERFGELEEVRSHNRDDDLSTLGYLTNHPKPGNAFGSYKSGTTWHSDDSYTTRPTAATFVLAKVVPPTGGDTMFANQYVAYETLSPTMRQIVGELSIIQEVPKRAMAPAVVELPTVHPLVRAHPETGRKALFLGDRNKRLYGMEDDESLPIIGLLNKHAVRYEFCYRHHWRPNDLVMWDNRALLHIALQDYDLMREERHMFRAACKGAEGGFPLTGEQQAA
jgi:taurine dioxygenase